MEDKLKLRNSYYYDLPEELIAQYPLKKRSDSRLLHLNKDNGAVSHHKFTDITQFLQSDDILVINKTKVIPARLYGEKDSGAKIEILLLNQNNENTWNCLVKPGKKLKPGTHIIFSEQLSATIQDYGPEGSRLVAFQFQGDFWKILEEFGKMPLPPYIHRNSREEDKQTYQTVYAEERGSVAAPTAGLHFTDEILADIRKMGVEILEVVLHVGLGTFRPVKSDNITHHKMHSEHCQISDETTRKINLAKKNGQRIIAVGTTTTRTLESFAVEGIMKSGSHWTDIFIYPGRKIQIIDGLLTNFHMPESTLLMLVSALAGYDNIMKAYKIAIINRYRFFSYGDAMLIL
jgi:S-adenosylmethionine:tRNA ribosyltransferase-isomerase